MYYVEEDNTIIKYEVVVDEEALQALRLEIINNCSKIMTYKINDATDIVRDNINADTLHVRDYQEKVAGNFICEGKSYPVYEVSFKYYEFPPIISYIDAVLNRDFEVLHRIFDPIKLYSIGNERSSFTKEFMREFNYYALVQKCITLTEVDRVLKSDVEKLKGFFTSNGDLAAAIVRR